MYTHTCIHTCMHRSVIWKARRRRSQPVQELHSTASRSITATGAQVMLPAGMGLVTEVSPVMEVSLAPVMRSPGTAWKSGRERMSAR